MAAAHQVDETSLERAASLEVSFALQHIFRHATIQIILCFYFFKLYTHDFAHIQACIQLDTYVQGWQDTANDTCTD